jgi:hypothetical protein
MVADIRSVDNDAEVVRLGRLIQTYQARITELSVQRERITMADTAANVVGRAQALAAGGTYQPVRTAGEIDDELAVLRGAIRRVDAQAIDARALATIRITRDEKLLERAAASRAKIAAACDALMAALHEAQALADGMDAAEISPTGVRWPGCGAPTIVESLAGLRIDCGVTDAETLLMLERRAGIRVEPVFMLQDRPAPAKPTMRRKIVDTIGEMISG